MLKNYKILGQYLYGNQLVLARRHFPDDYSLWVTSNPFDEYSGYNIRGSVDDIVAELELWKKKKSIISLFLNFTEEFKEG